MWNVKHPNGEPIGTNGYITAGYYGDPQQLQQQHHQQQHHQQQNQQYTFDDYTHYPHPEEYMNERNRAYFANGDQYAMPNKPRQRLESDCKSIYRIFSRPNTNALFSFQIPRTVTYQDYPTPTLDTIYQMNFAIKVSMARPMPVYHCIAMTLISGPRLPRATLRPPDGSSGKSSCEGHYCSAVICQNILVCDTTYRTGHSRKVKIFIFTKIRIKI